MHGFYIVVVNQVMGFAREVGSRVLFMDEGHLLVDQPPEQFFGSPENQRLKDFLSKVL